MKKTMIAVLTAGLMAKAVMTSTAASATEADGPTFTAGHNGSQMLIRADDTIVYLRPKASLRGLVTDGIMLVEGKWEEDVYTGTAYAFKKGCPPAPYKVRGSTVQKGNRLDLVLEGEGPLRDPGGCDVIGHSKASPHSRLVFDNLIGD